MTKQVELKGYDKNALDDLLGSASQENTNNKNTSTLPIDSIILPPSQPRRYFDAEALQSLANDIKQNGLLAPIAVRPTEDSTYELMAGERRLRACALIGLEEIPVNIIDCDDKTASRIRLAENLQREDLNAYEETIGILELLTILLETDTEDVVSILYRMAKEDKGEAAQNVLGCSESLTIQELFSKIGKITWQSFVTTRLPLLKLPTDIQEALASGLIEYTKACAIARIKDSSRRAELLKQAIDEKLSLSKIKEAVEGLLEASKQDKQDKQETPTKKLAAQIGEISSLIKKDKTLLQDNKKFNKVNKLAQQIFELLQPSNEV
ncbi:ParB/RepB/Spo0J family partition protein [Hassallia byssoidea VB512170]|uniref:ParB/RepB/Spo0J family partition protein n=1 Tax=Hassallia byssoidea VB512170 TaxID=1304833 RepID=A0A846HHJ6_9CYAN|nr:ParB/RepB/Spo0J family partition protein [Hassalia byssoidea]NEU76836.1 ParB/RepB/Spo0J family partition protein [Hassalia byssoidea VB512170]